MTTLRKAAQQALEVLERAGEELRWQAIGQAQRDLRAALAEPEQEQEPVAIRLSNGVIDVLGNALVPTGTLLYAAPPQRKPLTEEDVEQIADGIPVDDFVGPTTWHIKLARAIERAHGIKEKT